MTEINHDVFISYSTKDQTHKNDLKDVFDNEGITYFLDENDLALGEDIEFSLKSNLKNTHFTVLLVSKNSLLSTWVCLESIHRLQEESFTQKTTFLPVLVDLSVMSLDFPLEMARHFKAKLEELEAKRVEAKQLGISTKFYNDEIERIEKVLPQISDIVQKIKNGLSANFADKNRKDKDLEKLLRTIKAEQASQETGQDEQVKPKTTKAEKASKKTTQNQESSESSDELNIPDFEYYRNNYEFEDYFTLDLEACAEDDAGSDEYEIDYTDELLHFKTINSHSTCLLFKLDYPQQAGCIEFAIGTTFKWKKGTEPHLGLTFQAQAQGYFKTFLISASGQFIILDKGEIVNSQPIEHLKFKSGMALEVGIVVVYPEELDDITHQTCNVEYYINSERVFTEEGIQIPYTPDCFGLTLDLGGELEIEYLRSSKA